MADHPHTLETTALLTSTYGDSHWCKECAATVELDKTPFVTPLAAEQAAYRKRFKR